MSGVAVVPVQEYLSTSYRPDCEYLDGTLLERNVGEWDHSKLQARMIVYLTQLTLTEQIHVVPEQTGPSHFFPLLGSRCHRGGRPGAAGTDPDLTAVPLYRNSVPGRSHDGNAGAD